MEVKWKLVKVEIQNWLEERVHEFTCQESAYVGKDVMGFKDEYLFECLNEIFWAGFSINLHKYLEWLTKKTQH